MNEIKKYADLLRVHHYIKNLFIFLPLFFGLKLTDPAIVLKGVEAFIVFCLIASAVYILNDIFDLAEDQQHPRKNLRPLASGAVSISTASVIAVVLLLLGIAGGYFLSILPLIGLYVALNLIYTLYLKTVAIVDVIVVAVGFVIRLFVGSAVSHIGLSMWIVLVTFLLALFLAFAKRRDDVLILLQTGRSPRKNTAGYSLDFLNTAMSIMATIVIVSYLMYVASPEVVHRFNAPYLYLTTLFVVLGILRYLQITLVEQNSGSPTQILLHDRLIQMSILLWTLSITYFIY